MSSWLRTLGVAAMASLLLGSIGRAASDPPLFSADSDFGPFVYQTTLPGGGPILLVGDTAFIGTLPNISVFDRQPGTNSWQVSPSPTIPANSRTLAFDGRTVITGGGGSAHLFRRNSHGAWREVAVLMPADGNPSFGASVGIDGVQAIVGAVAGQTPSDSDAAYIFRREAGIWTEITRLASTTAVASRGLFGNQVRISGDTALVQEGARFSPVYIFERNKGGVDHWGLARKLTQQEISAGVALEGDTAALGFGEINTGAFILDRDAGGADAWGTAVFYGSGGTACCGPPDVSLSGNSISLGFGLGVFGRADVLARHQGGTNAWGRVSEFMALPTPPRSQQFRTSISGDTLLLRAADDAVYVLVSDIDRDGWRDGIDPCPRDPLNRIDKHCRRDIASAVAVDSLVTASDVTTAFETPQRVTVTGRYKNTSTTPIRNPFFAVTAMTAGGELTNGDGLRRGVGATLSPDVGDGILSPGESTVVTFQVRLKAPAAFEFQVSVMGDPEP